MVKEDFSIEISRNNELRNVFTGTKAFMLYDTYGFPLDLTADMIREYNIKKGTNVKLDIDGFEKLMNEQKARAKASWKGSGDAKAESGDFKELLEEFGENEFVGYDNLSWNSRILALLDKEWVMFYLIKLRFMLEVVGSAAIRAL